MPRAASVAYVAVVAFVASVACVAFVACAGPSGPQGTLATTAAAGGSLPTDAGAVAVDAAPPPDATPPPPPPPPEGYLKGQLHLHTGMSGDSDTPPNLVVHFYAEHGYDFIVVTDHNHVTELPPREGRMLVIAGVELTHSTTACEPPPEKRKKCLVHMNALFVDTPSPLDLPVAPITSIRRLALYLRFVDAARALGGLPMLNHPNFGWTADAALVADVGRHGVRLLEVFNQGMPISNPGDATHLSSEAIWDTVLAQGVTMWGVASDDAHHYYDVARVRAGLQEDAGVEEGGAGEANDAGAAEESAPAADAGVPTVYPGNLGWVMVHAERDPKSIRAALERGDFYASTGVTLAAILAEPDALVVDVAGTGPFHLECLGEGGRLLGDVHGTHVRCERPAGSRYVRVRAADAHGRHAWTQPLLRQP